MEKCNFKIRVKNTAKGEPMIQILGLNGEIVQSGEGYSSEQAMDHTLKLLLGAKLPSTFEDCR